MGKTVPRKINSTHGPRADGADVYVTRAFVPRRPIADPLAPWVADGGPGTLGSVTTPQHLRCIGTPARHGNASI